VLVAAISERSATAVKGLTVARGDAMTPCCDAGYARPRADGGRCPSRL